jgi:hypothetical protein
MLFTTPGDVRDYAIHKLHGKLVHNDNGSDTVLIPRNAKNKTKISKEALDLYSNGPKRTARVAYHASFKNGKDSGIKEYASNEDMHVNPDGSITTRNGNTGSVILPDVNVYAQKDYNSAFDYSGANEVMGTIADFTPVVGDVKQGLEAANDLRKGNYKEAAIGAGLLLLPNVLEKPLKYAGKKAFNFLSDITPKQWTAAQDAAIAKGDMAEALRLRNLHFMTKAPNTSARYNSYTPTLLQHGTDIPNHYVFGDELSFFNTHGGYDKTYRQNVYVNVPKLRVTNPKGYEIGHEYDLLLDADKGLSDGFVDLGVTEITEAEENYLLNNMDKVFGITPEEYRKLYETLPNYKDPSEIQLLKNDYPFIQFQQSHIDKEGIGKWHPLVSELAVKNPKNIKLADAVTYDDKGDRIPLGLRDNFNLNDIRWAIAPFGVGLTGYGLLKNQKTSRSSARKGNTKK